MQRLLIFSLFASGISACLGQSLGGAGTVEGTVTDPSGAAIVGATAELTNPLTNYKKSAQSDESGIFRFAGVPPNTYHLSVTSAGFTPATQDLVVRTAVPISIKIALSIAGETTSVTVEGESDHMLENVPYAHSDIDRSTFDKLPSSSPGSSLSDAIISTAPGVSGDSNGFFHPQGDHAQTTFSIDGQPISDQQSKKFSTKIPSNAIQSMELITGAPSAEFGDKTSLVVSAQTRSGLGQKRFGSFSAQYGSFGTVSEEATLGMGSAKM